MATLEDRILGEKLQYYCSSSSEDEDEQADSDGSPSHVPAAEKAPPPPDIKQREGCSVNVSTARADLSATLAVSIGSFHGARYSERPLGGPSAERGISPLAADVNSSPT
ncbi:hypothetical protein HPB50_005054 [Hyalomma asiaticum]|uniref:Uncharacterized protein n=1 Tax=Hyalomma asiaticum TaxID=266040 RepID=A0ACB7SQA4_HYAAI|nr:hypothetical protein HPB50_005054 [Hyalomma asiaticum]